jgi:predicted mannosyl-3-phosphoglycerate phosphatase (HAD superfamily)
MKAIIIEEHCFDSLLDSIKLATLKTVENSYLKEHTGLTEEQIKWAADEMYRSFHFHFVRWAQDQGVRFSR